jgi:N-carbamoyl-L-amino-acid hydrolase
MNRIVLEKGPIEYQLLGNTEPSVALHTAQYAPTAMIFVPCAGALSHNEADSAKEEDLAAGADVLLQVVLRAANE